MLIIFLEVEETTIEESKKTLITETEDFIFLSTETCSAKHLRGIQSYMRVIPKGVTTMWKQVRVVRIVQILLYVPHGILSGK